MDQQRHRRLLFFPPCVLVLSPLGERRLGSQQNSLNEVNVKRKLLTQIVLVIVGLFNVALIYFLFRDLWHSSWLLERKNEIEPMFLSFFIPVGVFLLIAARRPSEHRSMIALAAWWNISHGAVMAIQTVEAWIHGVHQELYRCDPIPCDRSCPVSGSASKTRGSRAGNCVNERRNPTLYADDRFFSCSLNG